MSLTASSVSSTESVGPSNRHHRLHISASPSSSNELSVRVSEKDDNQPDLLSKVLDDFNVSHGITKILTKATKYLSKLVDADVISEAHSLVLMSSKYTKSIKTLYTTMKNLSTGGLNLLEDLNLSKDLGLPRLLNLLDDVVNVKNFFNYPAIMNQVLNTKKNLSDTFFALKQGSVQTLLDTGFKGIEQLITLANMKDGIPMIGNMVEFLKTASSEAIKFLKIENLSVKNLMKLFKPEKWLKVLPTLQNISIMKFYSLGKIGLSLILKIAKLDSKIRDNILNTMDAVVKKATKSGMQVWNINLKELNISLIIKFFADMDRNKILKIMEKTLATGLPLLGEIVLTSLGINVDGTAIKERTVKCFPCLRGK